MQSKDYQHGDVLLKNISQLPEGAKEVKREQGLIILGRGEATGHHHTVAEKAATLYELKGELYLEATLPVTITHEEHKPMTVPTGIYRIGQVREYDYLKEMERKVVD